MRNAVSLFKQYCPSKSLSRKDEALWTGWVCFCVVLPVASAVLASPWPSAALASPSRPALAAGGAPHQGAQNPHGERPPSLPGRPAPELAAIFLPRAAPPGAYQLTVLDEPIEAARDRLRRELAPEASERDPPGAWSVKRVEPLVAFGEAGLYNRSRLSRLFTGRPAHLVRAPISRAGRVVASLTLISPCPNADLTQLTGRTLAILFVVDEARNAR